MRFSLGELWFRFLRTTGAFFFVLEGDATGFFVGVLGAAAVGGVVDVCAWAREDSEEKSPPRTNNNTKIKNNCRRYETTMI
jgi:hypothetical protein